MSSFQPSFPRIILLLVATTFHWLQIFGQTDDLHRYFEIITLKVDTTVFESRKNSLILEEEDYLYFDYQTEEATTEIRFYPWENIQIEEISLRPSIDFDIIDSISLIDGHFRTKIRFKDLTASDFLSLILSLGINENDSAYSINHELKLFPVTRTNIDVARRDDEMYIGEEKILELATNQVSNIKPDPAWKTSPEGDQYKITKEDGVLRLHILPEKLGPRALNINLNTYKPALGEEGKLIYDFPTLTFNYQVSANRLAFLQPNLNEITLDQNTRTQGVRLEITNNRYLELNKTYRIEAQEDPGGALVAELFTLSRMANGRVMCLIRPFNLHRKSQGYLYIKDGDQIRFLTNLDITPRATIERVTLLKEAGDWTENLTVKPGEKFDIRIEGQGLHHARFNLDEIEILSDTMWNEGEWRLKAVVPITVGKRSFGLYNHSDETKFRFRIAEYQVPKDFDFVYIDWGEGPRPVTKLTAAVLFDQTVKDIVISFDASKIDDSEHLYGRQHLAFDVRISDRKGNLVDQVTIQDIIVCPEEPSPRRNFYSSDGCNVVDISLNSFLRRKTYDLDEWSNIEINVRHDRTKYSQRAIGRKFSLFLQRYTNFDLDVSFPAGLLIRKQDENFSTLSGISLGIVAQMSFYNPKRQAKFRPYKVGIGFLALNAFNFSEDNDNRDVGIVLIGSLIPFQKERKLTFPLFLGGGYLLSDRKWFMLLGPGIRLTI